MLSVDFGFESFRLRIELVLKITIRRSSWINFSLVDKPGRNTDSLTTVAVFARQER